MPSIDRLRELIGPNGDLNDRELRELRRQIQTLAELIVDPASDTLTPSNQPKRISSVEEKPEVN
jgi:hypothetical protein